MLQNTRSSLNPSVCLPWRAYRSARAWACVSACACVCIYNDVQEGVGAGLRCYQTFQSLILSLITTDNDNKHNNSTLTRHCCPRNNWRRAYLQITLSHLWSVDYVTLIERIWRLLRHIYDVIVLLVEIRLSRVSIPMKSNCLFCGVQEKLLFFVLYRSWLESNGCMYQLVPSVQTG